MVGRPKTLNREHALAIALEGYWREGVYGMSVNEVCRRAKISKPGLYREVGGEDGLLTAVLQLYRETVMETLAEHLRQDSSFKKVFHWYVNALLHQNGHPPGCLLCEMRLIQSEDLGQATREKVQECADDIYGFYRDWLEGACTARIFVPDKEREKEARRDKQKCSFGGVISLLPPSSQSHIT